MTSWPDISITKNNTMHLSYCVSITFLAEAWLLKSRHFHSCKTANPSSFELSAPHTQKTFHYNKILHDISPAESFTMAQRPDLNRLVHYFNGVAKEIQLLSNHPLFDIENLSAAQTANPKQYIDGRTENLSLYMDQRFNMPEARIEKQELVRLAE